MAGRPPDELIDQFVEDTVENTTRELMRKYGIAESTARDWRLWCAMQGHTVGYGTGMRFVNRATPLDKASDQEIWELMHRLSEKKDAQRQAQDFLQIVLDEDLPYGIALTGDWHIGIEGVLYEQMDQDFNLMAGVPGLLAIGMGDYAHNPKIQMRAGSSLYHMILPNPDDQYRMVLHQAKKLAGQWVGLIKGCHDDWDSTLVGFERVVGMARELDTAYLGHGAVIQIQLGDQEYNILARHKYKFESSINITNSQRRAWENVSQVDAVIFAHLHNSVSHKEVRGGQEVIYARSGSYLHWDEFGMKIGHHKGERGVPILIIYPGEKRIVNFHGRDMEVALRFLETERQRYAVR